MLNTRTDIDYIVCVFLLWSYRGDTRTIYSIALYGFISVFKRFVLCLVCLYISLFKVHERVIWVSCVHVVFVDVHVQARDYLHACVYEPTSSGGR